MAIQQIGLNPYYTVQTGGNSETNQKKENNVIADEWAALAYAAKQSEDAYMKRMEVEKLKAENNAKLENIRAQQAEVERVQKEFSKSINSKGSARVDSGQSGFMRWLSNAGTAIVNIGKSIIGFDKDGNWDPVKCITNVGITALAIGATFIPYVGPIIGYGLLTAGVVGGAIGVANGISKLEEAEKSGDQKKIDEAQQDICGEAFIGITSACGLRGVGRAFRTSSATAELASSATARTSMGGKCIESVSNISRDITVNAFKATKYSAKNRITPSLSGFRSWEKQYGIKNKQMADMYTQKLAELDSKIAAETNPAKKILLQEQKQMLEANNAEFSKIGTNIKTKAEFDKLAQDNAAKFNQEYVQNAYTRKPSGEFDVNGILIKKQEFLKFQNTMMRQQRALDKELQQLIKAKENMMRSFAQKPKKHRAALDEYVSTANIKRSWLKPSSWVKSKELLAIGGKNPGYGTKIFGSMLTSPASNVAKASGAWVSPIYSGAFLYTMELTPEETQAQLNSLQTAIDGVKALREKMENAETIEEFNAALEEYDQLVNASNGEQVVQSTTE